MKRHCVVTNLPNGLAVALELITPDPAGTHAGRRPGKQWCVGRIEHSANFIEYEKSQVRGLR
jgi:hypothetical protein